MCHDIQDMGSFKKLSKKQQAFVIAYLKSKSATQAAKDAGYSIKSAHSDGPRLLAHAGIKEAIAKELEALNEKNRLKASDVLAEIQKIAFADLSNAFDAQGKLLHPKEMPEDIRKSLTLIATDELFDGYGKEKELIGQTKTIKIADKLKALELLAKHFKLLTELVEHSGKLDGEVVIVELPAKVPVE